MEACRAYACKQILGLCHSPPRLENQSVLRTIEKPHGGKKQTAATKNLFCGGEMDAVVQHMSWYVPEQSVSYLRRGRLEVLTLSYDLVLCL